MSRDNLFFKTNTAKSILDGAHLFKHTHNVIWEYVSNELDSLINIKRKPVVHVNFEKDKIVISGNGTGMDHTGLQNFFTMHGENLARKKGIKVRGRNGTGKSAAFAIANSFYLSTNKNKKNYSIKLTKKELNKYKIKGENIPLKNYIINYGEKTNEADGTKVVISELFSKSNNKKDTIDYIEKHLGSYGKGAEVWVDKHPCEFKEPISKQTYRFKSDKTHPNLGNIELIIKVAAEPLDKGKNRIRINSNNVLLEETLCGSEGREMSEFIFGEIDCPKLDYDGDKEANSTVARDMTLSTSSSLVKELYSFIGPKVEEIRKKLVEQDKDEKESEEAKKLQKIADTAAEKINNHFEQYKDKIRMTVNRISNGNVGTAKAYNSQNLNENGSLSVGDELEAIINNDFKSLGKFGENKANTNKKNNSNIQEKKNEDKRAKRVNGTGKNKSSGGSRFLVKYKHNTASNNRAKFDRDNNIVYINLDHPQIVDIKKKSKDNEWLFKTTTYEIAFTEYAFGLSYLLLEKKWFKENTDEYLAEALKIINDLSNI